mgnify:CR=1 FL=1
MTAETKKFIETHINMIENNGIASTYLDCPLRILNDFNNTLHYADIDYPSEIHVYVVVCCYIATHFKDVRLQSYDFDYPSEKEEYKFTCENCLYDRVRLQQSLSRLLPKRRIIVEAHSSLLYTGNNILKIHVIVN